MQVTGTHLERIMSLIVLCVLRSLCVSEYMHGEYEHVWGGVTLYTFGGQRMMSVVLIYHFPFT
jgi:Zn-dependent protease